MSEVRIERLQPERATVTTVRFPTDPVDKWSNPEWSSDQRS